MQHAQKVRQIVVAAGGAALNSKNLPGWPILAGLAGGAALNSDSGVAYLFEFGL